MTEIDDVVRRAAIIAGVPLGAALGGIVAVVLGTEIATAVGYGAAGGVVLAAVFTPARARFRERDAPTWHFLVVGLVAGIVVGAVAGAVIALTGDAVVVRGAGVGAGSGGVVGLALAGVLIAVERRRTSTT